jgi:hypothetical protein
VAPLEIGRTVARERHFGGIARFGFLFQRFREPDFGEEPVIPAIRLSRLIALLAAALLAFTAAPGWAAVSITFYSKELGASFPHAFVVLEGTLDRGGPRIEEDYGFTAKTISPAILWGKVAGKVDSEHSAGYVKDSDRHFTVELTDAEYDRVMATVERWRAAKQPNYDLDKHNCVHFVAELAAAIGMTPDTRKLMKKPRSFLETMTAQNRAWLTSRKAILHRTGPVAAPKVVPRA